MSAARPAPAAGPADGAPPARAPARAARPKADGATLARAAAAGPADGAAPARPFLKWAGGKRRLLPDLVRHLPGSFGTYYEPFLGGGALFFHLRPRRAVLGDANERLVRAYRGVQGSVDDVIRILRSYPPTRDTFESLRALDVDRGSDAEVAAWFVFLNRLGYNGLYRVNRAGRFNVPFGDYANPRVCDEATLRACAAALAGAELVVSDFAEVAASARRGDVAYFDPPYVPLSATSSFTSYTSKGFSPADQARLRDQARALAARGVTALVSNSSAPAVHELYAGDDFSLAPVRAARAINCKPGGRGAVVELVIVARPKPVRTPRSATATAPTKAAGAKAAKAPKAASKAAGAKATKATKAAPKAAGAKTAKAPKARSPRTG
ncbi:MAG TPA: Dam family site-specific DNA-(adenine-N6)-methyltransferase [Polyangiaceae bacterium]|nr:Dam family site-specific DNA-(adenine-N6)-methyltransferase [Polyangiaceae bacterium]